MMNNNHIVALVGNNTSTLPTWAKLISDAGIPVLGGVAETSDPWLTNPDFYSTGTTVESAFYATQFAVKQAGFTKEAVLDCNQVTACLASLQPIRNYAKTLGINLVYAQYASPTATDYTAQCLAMKTAGAQVVEAVVNDALLAANCKAQSYTPVYFAPDDDVTIAQIKATPSFEGAIGFTTTFWTSQEFPQTKEYFDAMKQYAPQYLAGGSKVRPEQRRHRHIGNFLVGRLRLR
jgi:branched-chain amino acid transport system substrate-binding protein